jgi:RsiW-degrading membrane proteinase PrsW (M82 family)
MNLRRAVSGVSFATMLVPDLIPAAMVGAAIGPCLLLLWLAVVADSRPEPPRMVLIAVVLGAFSGVAAGGVELWLRRHLPIAHNPWLAADEAALFIADIPEETMKILVIAAIALRARDFDEPMDGVVYGTAVGLGFAALENLLYLVGFRASWQSVAVARGILSVPLHGALGAIAGAYIASARFGGALGAHKGRRWPRARLFFLAWLVPVVLHAVYDASAFASGVAQRNAAGAIDGAPAPLLMLLIAPAVSFGSVIFAARLARRIARRQKAALETKRVPPIRWRPVWGQCLIGVALTFVSLPLVIAGNSPLAKFFGLVLFVFAIAVARTCARYLNTVARHRHYAAAAASP